MHVQFSSVEKLSEFNYLNFQQYNAISSISKGYSFAWSIFAYCKSIQVNSRYNDSGYNIIPVCTYKLLWSRTKHDHSHTILDVYNIRYNIILVITTKINRPTGS